jgi:hypothetical protein
MAASAAAAAAAAATGPHSPCSLLAPPPPPRNAAASPNSSAVNGATPPGLCEGACGGCAWVEAGSSAPPEQQQTPLRRPRWGSESSCGDSCGSAEGVGGPPTPLAAYAASTGGGGCGPTPSRGRRRDARAAARNGWALVVHAVADLAAALAGVDMGGPEEASSMPGEFAGALACAATLARRCPLLRDAAVRHVLAGWPAGQSENEAALIAFLSRVIGDALAVARVEEAAGGGGGGGREILSAGALVRGAPPPPPPVASHAVGRVCDPARVQRSIASRVTSCMASEHLVVSAAALEVVGPPSDDLYELFAGHGLAPVLLRGIETSRGHWHAGIREMGALILARRAPCEPEQIPVMIG